MVIAVFIACSAFLLLLWILGAPAFPALFLSATFALVATLQAVRLWRLSKQPVEKKDSYP